MIDNIVIKIIFILSSYLIGAIPFSYIIAKLFKGIDIRKKGTKNVGASNVYKSVGSFYGILAGIFDILKGIVVILIGKTYFDLIIILIAGLVAIAGHIYPIYLGFKGGKGTAVSIGVLIPFMPYELIIILVIYAILILSFKKFRITGTIVLSLLPILGLIFKRDYLVIIFSFIVVVLKWLVNINEMNKLLRE